MNPRPFPEGLPPEETEVSFVPMAAVEEESGRLDASQVRTLATTRKGYTPFKENDVVFAKITPCMENGKIALATNLKNGLGYGSTEFFVFRPYQGVLPQYVLYFLLQTSFRRDAERQMIGAVGQKRVPSKYLFAHDFPLAPTNEQERIVAKLDELMSRLAAGEAATRRALERLQRYRAAVLHAAVTGELTRDWRRTHSAGENGTQILHYILQERRARWEQAKLNDFHTRDKIPKDDKWKKQYSEPIEPKTNTTQFDSQRNLPKNWTVASISQLSWNASYGTSVKCTHESNGPAVLRIPNVRNGEINFDDLKFATEPNALSDEDFIAPGDLLLIRTNGSINLIGRAAVAKTSPQQKCGFASYLIRFRLVGSDSLWSWISLALGSDMLRSEIQSRAATTAGQYNISLSGLANLSFPLPPPLEQMEIIRQVELRLTAAEQLTTQLNHQLERSRKTRQSLLREAFTGQLVSQNPSDDSASILLERIRATRATEVHKKLGTPRKEPVSSRQEKSTLMSQPTPSLDDLRTAWLKIDKQPNAKRLFDAAGFDPEHVVRFYELLRESPDIRDAFETSVKSNPQSDITGSQFLEETEKPGRFRLVSLWLEDFKNLKNYEVRFDPGYGLDVILGWNGTGKSNLFEALLIIFRDLHYWWEKNRWPEESMAAYHLVYEIENNRVEVAWEPTKMKRPEVKKILLAEVEKKETNPQPIKREDLLLPKFVFGYYSGPTNRLAEHFIPMERDHYDRLRKADSDDPETLARLLEQRRFFCAETRHAKYVLLAFAYKEDQKINHFLEHRLRILGFESALFVIRRPRWARKGSTAQDFWGATGIMLRVMEKLRDFAVAPMVIEQVVSDGYRSTKEDHYFFFLPDLKSLHAFAAEYADARSFFLALESTDFSELIHDAKIQVKVKSSEDTQIPITFRELSEGEQQLLMVLGLMRFTKSHQSLILLDEPDTHLNPHWSVEYVKDLMSVISEDENPSPEQQTSQMLMATHDPLVIASFVKEQVHLLKRDPESLRCYWNQASENPRGMGYTGILISDMFGFRSDLDEETLALLDRQASLATKPDALSPMEKDELGALSKRIDALGFKTVSSDPYYRVFIEALGRQQAIMELMKKPIQTQEDRTKIRQAADEILSELARKHEFQI